jgi:protein gp37
MAQNSKIEWTDHTFNPWMGCTKVSDGCKHCYAESLMDHRYGKVEWGPQGTRQRTSTANWRKPLQWNKQAGAEGKRYRVFCASLADVFEDRPELAPWRADLFDLIEQTPNLDWLLLTKRPENIMRHVEQAGEFLLKNAHNRAAVQWLTWVKHGMDYALPNVWIGTSVEDQETADKRIPELMRIPARVLFLSCEPLLGPVDLWGARYRNNGGLTGAVTSWPGGVNWVIVGGESGHGARPMQIEWAQAMRRECQAAGVAFFMKQLGGPIDKRHDITTFPADLQVREFPIQGPA